MITRLEYERRPSVPAFMLRALFPPALRRKGPFPAIAVRWSRHRVDPRGLEELRRLGSSGSAPTLPLLYPHVLGFPLQMVILTHPSFPLPIWRTLQIRNHLLQHQPIPADAVLDLETRVAGQRVLEKGVEVDLHATAAVSGRTVWESLNTFYYRGRFGPPGPPSPLSSAPPVGDEVIARWRTPSAGGLGFGALTGDYNGIHWSSAYARALGFRRALHHPQRVLAQALAHLPTPGPAGALRLDAWLRGPVYYGSEVSLRATRAADGASFGLFAEGEPRPAIVGRLRGVTAPGGLLDGAAPA